MWHLVHLPRGLADQQAQHLGLGRELDQRPLDRLVLGERLAERLCARARNSRSRRCSRPPRPASSRPGGCGSRGRSSARGRGRGRLAEQARRDQDVGEAGPRVVGRHVEGPQYSSTFTPGVRSGRGSGDAPGVAVSPLCARKRAMRRDVHAGGPHLLAVDPPAASSRLSCTARVSMWVASEPWWARSGRRRRDFAGNRAPR